MEVAPVEAAPEGTALPAASADAAPMVERVRGLRPLRRCPGALVARPSAGGRLSWASLSLLILTVPDGPNTFKLCRLDAATF